MESFLIVLDLDDVIGFCVDNRLGDFFLAPHGVDGDNGSLQVQGFDQFRDGGDLIGLVRGLELAQHQGISEPQALTRCMAELPLARLWEPRKVLPAMATILP